MSRRQSARRAKRHADYEEVLFPVTPMLDMAFQLLAFFVLTFQVPTGETRLDLYLPVAAAALPSAPAGQAISKPPSRADLDLENDLLVLVEADELGEINVIRLGDAKVENLEILGDRLRKYAALLEGRSLRVRIAADDRLRYEEAAKIISACGSAGATSVRLADPKNLP